MSKTIEELSHSNGRVYVYFKTEAICRQFLIQAEQEGFTFGDGVKPTKRHTDSIIAVNKNRTLNYVGINGHIAYGSKTKYVGNQKLLRIDFDDYIG